MANNSKIEWTDTSWNPIFGCSKISEGCRNCYAEKMAKRLGAMGQSKYAHVITNGKWNGNISFSGKVIYAPMEWKKPRRIFVNSMSDLFHENFDMQNGYLHKIFEVMLHCTQHTFQVLTKRPARMQEFLSTHKPWLKALEEGRANHVWLGTSVENQKAAEARIPLLLSTPAGVRFLSCEPLLGPVDIKRFLLSDPKKWYMAKCEYCGYISSSEHMLEYRYHDDADMGCAKCERSICGDGIADDATIHWVIAGGESGHDARPMHPNWVYSLLDQCKTAKVPFFFKQWGQFGLGSDKPVNSVIVTNDGRTWSGVDGSKAIDAKTGEAKFFSSTEWNSLKPEMMHRASRKKDSGRYLDGRTWDEFPEV
jgi:protein gp37